VSITIKPVTCSNEDHSRPVLAIARLLWPTGRFRPTTACVGDLIRVVRDSLNEGAPVEVWPANREPDSALGFGRWRRAPDCDRCKDTGRFQENGVDAHCGCKRGRRMSELWYSEKHGHYHPDAFEPDPDPEGPPF
jgi:hypothetical protein